MMLCNLQHWPILVYLNVGLSTWARPDPCDQISPRPFSTRLKLLARLHKTVEACGPDNMDSKMVSMTCRWRIHDLRHYIRITYRYWYTGLVQVCLVANDCIMICQYGRMMQNVYRYTFNIFTQIISSPMVPQDLKAAGMPANEAGPGTSLAFADAVAPWADTRGKSHQSVQHVPQQELWKTVECGPQLQNQILLTFPSFLSVSAW